MSTNRYWEPAHFASTLEEVFDHSGKTYQEVADQTKPPTSKSYVWENVHGEANATEEKRKEIAEALGVSPSIEVIKPKSGSTFSRRRW
jgi:transcriptional regulator with XRE-family HTH domain